MPRAHTEYKHLLISNSLFGVLQCAIKTFNKRKLLLLFHCSHRSSPPKSSCCFVSFHFLSRIRLSSVNDVKRSNENCIFFYSFALFFNCEFYQIGNEVFFLLETYNIKVCLHMTNET